MQPLRVCYFFRPIRINNVMQSIFDIFLLRWDPRCDVKRGERQRWWRRQRQQRQWRQQQQLCKYLGSGRSHNYPDPIAARLGEPAVSLTPRWMMMDLLIYWLETRREEGRVLAKRVRKCIKVVVVTVGVTCWDILSRVLAPKSFSKYSRTSA